MQIVIISSWRRPTYLIRCLDALSKSRSIKDKLVWVFQNDREDPGIDLTPVHIILRAAKCWFPNFKVTYKAFIDTAEYPGAVWQQWDAWKQAYDLEAERVYFFSDDDVVTPDYFEWHDAVQADREWFATCAWRHVDGQTKPFDLEAYYQINYPEEIGRGLGINHKNLGIMLETPPIWCDPVRMVDWKIVMPYVQRVYHIGVRSSHLASVGENHGPVIDVLPNPIPDSGRQKVVLKS